ISRTHTSDRKRSDRNLFKLLHFYNNLLLVSLLLVNWAPNSNHCSLTALRGDCNVNNGNNQRSVAFWYRFRAHHRPGCGVQQQLRELLERELFHDAVPRPVAESGPDQPDAVLRTGRPARAVYDRSGVEPVFDAFGQSPAIYSGHK